MGAGRGVAAEKQAQFIKKKGKNSTSFCRAVLIALVMKKIIWDKAHKYSYSLTLSPHHLPNTTEGEDGNFGGLRHPPPLFFMVVLYSLGSFISLFVGDCSKPGKHKWEFHSKMRASSATQIFRIGCSFLSVAGRDPQSLWDGAEESWKNRVPGWFGLEGISGTILFHTLLWAGPWTH